LHNAGDFANLTIMKDIDKKSLMYQQHLNRVSRSFAFCIEKLGPPLRSPIGLSYLLCRLLDTVEDAPWSSPDSQARSFKIFETFIEFQPTEEMVANWQTMFPEGVPDGEKLLIKDALVLFTDFHGLEPKLRVAIYEPILSMCRGMRYFSEKSLQDSEQANSRDTLRSSLRLDTLSEVNQYCFFVAGVVGEILVRLVAAHDSFADQHINQGHLLDAFHFGLFLQKVNLLKDQRGDESEGRFLVPSREALVSSLHSHADASIRYILDLPKTLLSYRLFCSWSLFLGLASLDGIEKSFYTGEKVKLPRVKALQIFYRLQKISGDNEKLHSYFGDFFKNSPVLRTSKPEAGTGTVLDLGHLNHFNHFSNLYRGLLPLSTLEQLLS
jgi:hypothetical protein